MRFYNRPKSIEKLRNLKIHLLSVYRIVQIHIQRERNVAESRPGNREKFYRWKLLKLVITYNWNLQSGIFARKYVKKKISFKT